MLDFKKILLTQREKGGNMERISSLSLKRYFKPIAVLALPIAGQSLVSFLVNLADNVMIGSLGDVAVSGVYMGTQMFTLLQWFVTGITTSMTILIAQYWGRRDTETIGQITAIGMLFGVPVSLLFTVISLCFPAQLIGLFTNETAVIQAGIPYLQILALSFPFFCIFQIFVAVTRSVENAKIGLYISLAALILNIALNTLLIFGLLGFPALGVAGAAIATLVARIIEAATMIFYMFRREHTLLLRLNQFCRLDRNLIRRFLRYGAPVLLGELVWGFNTLMRSYFMGHFNTQIITAFSMINMLNEIVFIWILALEAAAGILTGKLIGSAKWREIRSYTYSMQVIFLLVGAAAVVVLFLLRGPFLALYSVSAEAKAAALSLSNVMIPVVFFSVYEDMTLCGIVKCGGETAFVLKVDSILVFLVMLPACLIGAQFGASAPLIYFFLQIDQIIKCVVAAVKVNHFHWVHDLTGQSRTAQLPPTETS